MLYNGDMATVRIYGAENRPSQPSFYILNRVDETSLPAIIKAMGGEENVAFRNISHSFGYVDVMCRYTDISYFTGSFSIL